MSHCIDTDHIVVNWVSELLQTAAVSSAVMLLREHVHMCTYNKAAMVLAHTEPRHLQQLIM